ncbi:hypothetical protein [Chitinophaga sp. MM2321]|uniref:hypothetical protein n=1 Tax=Chitinophaga sp. MM2321 TaxID=3137178 RepID=UPI0032D582E2
MSKRSSTIITIITTGLLVGSLDILTACIQFVLTTGKSFTKVLIFIASAAFGPAAFSGDPAMPWWGVFFHYCIAMAFTILFFLLYPKLPAMRKHPALTGIGYGIFIWVVMNILVLPLTRIPAAPFRLDGAVIGVIILIVMIGLPLSFIARERYKSI